MPYDYLIATIVTITLLIIPHSVIARIACIVVGGALGFLVGTYVGQTQKAIPQEDSVEEVSDTPDDYEHAPLT